MPLGRGHRNSSVLMVIIVAYLCVGVAYALVTPLWETPDEPAHYNYVRYLIEHQSLPVLRHGDYDFAYLERIKAARFPPEMSIDPIRYESHQPPLYYLAGAVLAAPLPEGWRPTALRLLSVLLGAVLLWVAYLVVIEVFPDRPVIAWGAAGFVATVPMHVAMTAAINNDTIAEVILGLILLMLVRRVMNRPGSHSTTGDLVLGVLMGLGLLTKTTTYVALPLSLMVLLAPSCLGRVGNRGPRESSLSAGRALGIALLMGLPWFVRNAVVYGGTDILGLARHNAIMTEQPRTAEWLAHLGWGGMLKQFGVTTFRSFWAQFGWMGILVDERIYLALAVVSALIGLGVLLFLLRDLKALSNQQKLALGVLALSFLLTLASYLWYNIQFVQHQGRYLFPALIPLSVCFALGMWKLVERPHAWYVAGLMLVAVVGLGIKGWSSGHLNKWLLAMLGGAAVALVLVALLPPRWRKTLYVLPFLGLWGLDVLCLVAFIAPYFRT